MRAVLAPGDAGRRAAGRRPRRRHRRPGRHAGSPSRRRRRRRPAHADRVAPARGAAPPPGQAAEPAPAAHRGLGARLRDRRRQPAPLHGAAAPQARSRTRPARGTCSPSPAWATASSRTSRHPRERPAASAGPVPRLIHLNGPPGIGKSRTSGARLEGGADVLGPARHTSKLPFAEPRCSRTSASKWAISSRRANIWKSTNRSRSRTRARGTWLAFSTEAPHSGQGMKRDGNNGLVPPCLTRFPGSFRAKRPVQSTCLG